MPVSAILALIQHFGPSAIGLITTLIQSAQTNTPVTLEQWKSLEASLNTTAADHVRAALKAAGKDLNSPESAALIAAAS